MPADLQGVILRCLKKDPDLRYPDALALEKALAACDGVGEWTAEMAEGWWRSRAKGAASPEAAKPERQAFSAGS